MRHRLRDIADIRLGYQVRGRVEDDPAGTHRLIQIRDFDDTRALDSSNLVRLTPKRDPEPALARPGDVLFLSRGHHLWATALSDPPAGAMISGYFLIVRPTEAGVRPGYLAWYLNQDPFQRGLREFVRGSHMPLVSLTDFRELSVEVPTIETQEAIIAVDGLRRRESELLRQIEAGRGKMVTAICLRAAQARIPGGVGND